MGFSCLLRSWLNAYIVFLGYCLLVRYTVRWLIELALTNKYKPSKGWRSLIKCKFLSQILNYLLSTAEPYISELRNASHFRLSQVFLLKRCLYLGNQPKVLLCRFLFCLLALIKSKFETRRIAEGASKLKGKSRIIKGNSLSSTLG